MQWFRLYDDLLDDPKAQQLKPELFKHWINLLCLANKGTPRGTLPDMKSIAFRLRLSETKADELVDRFILMGLLDYDDETLRPHNWDRRQRSSDDVAERVRKHRSNVTDSLPETPMKLSGATDTDTDTEQKQNRERDERVTAPSIKPDPKPRAHRLPKDWAPDQDAIQWAVNSTGLSPADVEAETEKFRDHFSGNGKTMTDWLATWRNWIRRSLDFRPTGPTPIRPPTRPQLPPVMQPGNVPKDGGLAEWRNAGSSGA